MDYQLNLWSEFVSYKHVAPLIREMKNYNMGIIQSIDAERLDDFKLIYDSCQEYNVPLSIWPLLSEEKGYWINAGNIPDTKDLIERIIKMYPEIEFIAFDFELPKEMNGVKKYIFGRKTIQYPYRRYFQDQLDGLVDFIHDHGMKVLNTTYPMLPHFYQNYGLLLPKIADFYSAMIYTSYFQSIFGNTFINKRQCIAMTYIQAKIYKKEYGKKAALDLGRISNGAIRSSLYPVHSLGHICKEIDAALHAGVKNIQVFALDDNIFHYKDNYDEFFGSLASCKPHLSDELRTYLQSPGWKPVVYGKLAKF